MKKEFIPYELALELKQLGFDEPCLASYYRAGRRLNICEYINHGEYTVLAPTYSQAFRFFRENHKLHSNVKCVDTVANNHFRYEIESNGETLVCRNRIESYEEVELACLKKLIEIANDKQ
jgi:hypothetical protein